MAAAEPLQTIKAEVTCSICLELFRDPVTSECGHSFCRECIARHCQGDGDVTCPLCKEKLQQRHLRPNRELRNIVESLRSQTVEDPRGGNLCETHQQPLQLYCKEDQSRICVFCERSQAHRGHTVAPVEEAVQAYWVDVKSLVSRFLEWLFPVLWEICVGDQAGVSPAGQGAAQTESGGDTGREPGSEPAAEKQEETGSHVSPVGEEAPTPKDRLDQATLDPTIHKISDTREGAEPQADAPSRGDSFQSQSPVRPASPSGSSGQVGVSPGGCVARPPELQGCAVEVTLDPATAHPRLVLSEDWKRVERGDPWQDLPDNLERFDTSVCVLGSEGFTSGRHYWEVEVGPREGWAIGVARDSVQRKGRIQPKPDFGIWALGSFNVPELPRKVGVYLDYEGGEVRFYNAETMALISSLRATFTGRLVPFFLLWTVGSQLSLSPCQR